MSTKLLKHEKFKLIFYAKIESKQIKKMRRNLKTGNNRGNLEIEKESWKKLKKKRRKENGGKLSHLSYSMLHLYYRHITWGHLCGDIVTSISYILLSVCIIFLQYIIVYQIYKTHEVGSLMVAEQSNDLQRKS